MINSQNKGVSNIRQLLNSNIIDRLSKLKAPCREYRQLRRYICLVK